MNEESIKIQQLTKDVAKWKNRVLEMAEMNCRKCKLLEMDKIGDCSECRVLRIRKEAAE